MSKLSDLALRSDLQLGPMLVSPSRRLVEGPGGSAHLEPLIMQVFLLLLDAGGKVVTRNELFDQCWGGVMVGDDSLNRAIAKVRRTGGHVAPGLFEIETIPRTGYRLTGDVFSPQGDELAEARGRDATRLVSRRILIGGVAAAAAGLAGGGFWWSQRQEDRKFVDLLKRGNDALNSSDPDDNPSQYFRQAVAMRPDNADALGLFAYSQALRGDTDKTADGQTWLQEASRTADAALAIDPRQPDARLTQIVLESGTLDLASTEDRLRQVLATDPTNIQAMRMLWNMLQCAGRSRDALALVERSLTIEPLASGGHYPRAQLLWITGRVAEADNVIAKAMQFWPTHRFVRFARFTIYAFTGRPGAALAMIENPETAPQNFSPASIALWRKTLPALDQRTPASIATARQAILQATKSNLRMTAQAAMVMSELGELDTAFDLTNAYFGVGRATRSRTAAGAPSKSTAWRFTPWMFTPPIAAMRADPRFGTLTDQIGLSSYWRAREIRPDYLAFPD